MFINISFIILIISFLFGLGIMLFALSVVFMEFLGAPFVPIRSKQLKEITDTLSLSNGKVGQGKSFVDLGSGDGKVVRAFAKTGKFKKCVGVELNPVLVWYCKLLSVIPSLPFRHPERAKRVEGSVSFQRANIFSVNLKNYDVIFIFLLPKYVALLGEKMRKECKKGTIIIAHGFEAKNLKKYEYKTIPRPTYTTYFYRIK